MTNAEYIRKKAQVAVLAEIMTEFKYGTSLDTAQRSLEAQCKEYEKSNNLNGQKGGVEHGM